jgi:putative Mg2+ transporter-C (MgtC) family protein
MARMLAFWDMDLGLWNVIIRIAGAVVFGLLLGLEREWRGRSAGARTLVLVCLGAALFVVAGEEVVASTPGASRFAILAPIVAAIIGGVGFLGAGAIMRNAGRVEGVTTAAAIWVTAGVGVTCGLGEFALAAICGVAALATLGFVRFEQRRKPGPPDQRADDD